MNFKKWLFAIVGCAIVLGALAAWKIMDIRSAIATAKAYPEQIETVEAGTVTTAKFTPTISVMGEIVAPQRLDLRNEIAGVITAVNFHSGDRVRAGQLLIQLDVAVEKANLEGAKAKAELTRVVHARIVKLVESKVATAGELDKAQADLAAARADIAVLERTIEKKTLHAPFNGRAGLHNFEVGQFLPANTLVASLIGDTANMWVDFQMPQFYPQLPAGTQVSLVTIGNDNNAVPVTASVIAENTVLNANNRSRAYRASIANDSQRYIPYTVVQLAVPTAAPQTLLQVPAIAVLNDPLGQYVYILHDGGPGQGLRAARQQVQVKLMEADRALIESTGLKSGDLIAVAGAFKLYQGILVKTRDRNPADNKGSDAAATVKTDAVSR